mmetsp:Transcript_140433/g.448830  ORF Transcript_140433/g.448830 Transcript_140433/m.448830 type:complete len:225 (-) Transcript_140433:1458-2132(-)
MKINNSCASCCWKPLNSGLCCPIKDFNSVGTQLSWLLDHIWASNRPNSRASRPFIDRGELLKSVGKGGGASGEPAKKLRKAPEFERHCRVAFMKQVLPKLCNPHAPGRTQTPPRLCVRVSSGATSSSFSKLFVSNSAKRSDSIGSHSVSRFVEPALLTWTKTAISSQFTSCTSHCFHDPSIFASSESYRRKSWNPLFSRPTLHGYSLLRNCARRIDVCASHSRP